MQVRPVWLVAGALVGGALLLALTRNGAKGAGEAIGQGAVDLIEGVVTGGAGAAGAVVGLPMPNETTQDPAVARWIIDRHGYMTASRWASAGAFLRAFSLPEGSGKPPPPGSAADKALGIDFGKGEGW